MKRRGIALLARMILSLFMAYKALSEPIELPEQHLASFVRKGFAVVEWGGAEIR